VISGRDTGIPGLTITADRCRGLGVRSGDGRRDGRCVIGRGLIRDRREFDVPKIVSAIFLKKKERILENLHCSVQRTVRKHSLFQCVLHVMI